MYWLILAGAAALYFWWQGCSLTRTRLTFQSDRLPRAFDGYRILHLSDLHNQRFGAGQRRLLRAVRDTAPDLIVCTGDLIDKRRTRADTLAPVCELIAGAAAVAPVYWISGNHEQTIPTVFARLQTELAAAGAVLLDDSGVTLTRGGATVSLCGLRGIATRGSLFGVRTAVNPAETPALLYPQTLAELRGERTDFCLLLAHRPEQFPLYAAAGADLIFSGHAHGGQIRLPGVGGIFAPDQGFFPQYTTGLYRMDAAGLAVSRGLGNSLCPFRAFNRPELVLLTLRR